MCSSLASPEKASPALQETDPAVSCNVSFPCSVQGSTTLCTPLHVGPASIAPPGNPLLFCLSTTVVGHLSLPPWICSPRRPAQLCKALACSLHLWERMLQTQCSRLPWCRHHDAPRAGAGRAPRWAERRCTPLNWTLPGGCQKAGCKAVTRSHFPAVIFDILIIY